MQGVQAVLLVPEAAANRNSDLMESPDGFIPSFSLSVGLEGRCKLLLLAVAAELQWV